MVNEQDALLRILIENQERTFSIRQLALLRKINYKSAYVAMTKLCEEGSVSFTRFGNSIQCSFTRRFGPRVFAVEFLRQQEFLKDKNMRVMQAAFDRVSQPFVLLAFGSTVKGTAHKHSDVDLLAVAEGASALEAVASLIALPVHLTTLKHKEFMSVADKRAFNVLSEAMKKNVILVGIEEYYRLVRHAGREADSGGTQVNPVVF